MIKPDELLVSVSGSIMAGLEACKPGESAMMLRSELITTQIGARVGSGDV